MEKSLYEQALEILQREKFEELDLRKLAELYARLDNQFIREAEEDITEEHLELFETLLFFVKNRMIKLTMKEQGYRFNTELTIQQWEKEP